MLSPRSGSRAQAVVVALVLLVAEHVWAGPLRVSNLVVTNSERTLLVHLVLRFQVELWQSVSWWVDRRIAAKILERQVVYDVLTKEYRVTAVQGEERDPYVTRDIWEAERVMSDVKALRLFPITSLSVQDLYYVRARADLRTGTPDSFSKLMPFWSSRIETSWEQSPLLTIGRSR